MATPQSEPTPAPWDTSFGNRFAYFSSSDHSAPLWIAAILSFIYVLGVLILRMFIKWRFLGWDDFLLAASTVVACVQSILIFKGLHVGLGKVPERATDILFAGKLVFSSRILLLPSLYLAKISVLLLLRRIFVREQKRLAFLCDTVVGVTVAGGLASVLVSSVKCPTSNFFADHCDEQVTRWIIVAAIDFFTEALILILPPYMLWDLQMRVGTKFRVIAAFCFRIVVIALCAAHLRVWIGYTQGDPSTFAIVPTLVWQQALLTTSLVTASIPNLKAFTQSLAARWGEGQGLWGYTTKASGNGTFEMDSMSKNAPPTIRSTSRKVTVGKYAQKSQAGFQTEITTSEHVAGDRGSLGSGGSQDLIIRKQTVFSVERS